MPWVGALLPRQGCANPAGVPDPTQPNPTSLCQIDLGDPKKVTGIITQGARDFGHIQYVAAYKVAYSDNGTSWTLYRDSQTNSTKVRGGELRGARGHLGVGRGGTGEIRAGNGVLTSTFSPSQIFHGNSDNYSHKKNVFDVPFYARFVRVLPVAWHNRITLRLELLGCDE